MSRTRGKSAGTSPSGSVSGSEQLDSSENQQENLSSENNSLDSNPGDGGSGPASLEGQAEKLGLASDGASMEANPAYEGTSDNESLNELVMPKSETASQDNSLLIISETTEVKAGDEVSGTDEEESQETEKAENRVEVSDVIIQEGEKPENKDERFDSEMCQPIEVEEITDQYNAQPMSSSIITPKVIVSSSLDSEIIIDQNEIIVSVEETEKEIDDGLESEMIPTLLPDVSPPSEQVGHEEPEMEHHSHLSTSSDIKLPDPIYETSDDGSISSERHQQECGSFNLQDEEHNQESRPVADEVFNENETHFEKQNSPSHLIAAYESQFDIGGMQDSIFAYEESDAALSGVSEQPKELEEEKFYSIPAENTDLVDVGNIDVNAEENKENINSEPSFNQMNPFAADNSRDYDAYADKENVEFHSQDNTNHDPSVYNNDMFSEQSNFENNQIQPTDSSNNPFSSQESTLLDQNFENLPILDKSSTVPSESVDLNNVTLIKAEGSNDCIGIISSVENDHICNDLVKQNKQNELLKPYQYSSLTDSEESSLDSNLSQVMTVEVNENSVGLNNENESTFVSNNVQGENPFNEYAVNGSSDLKSNGDHYSETQVISNGHRLVFKWHYIYNYMCYVVLMLVIFVLDKYVEIFQSIIKSLNLLL